MTTIQCSQCAAAIARDAYDRLPPWCPYCGGDIKAGRAVAAGAANAAAAGPAPGAAPGDPNSLLAAKPPVASIADAPGEESLAAFAARLAAARQQPTQYTGKKATASLRYFLIAVFLLAIALAWLYTE